jgi:RND family efflux transporter MFP subunit
MVLVVVVIAVLTAVLFVRSRPKQVPAALPVEKIVTESIAASGRLRGATESDIGAQNQGRVAAILVKEGDTVQAGQVIARLDDSVLEAQEAQSQIALQTAERQLLKAEEVVKTTQAELEKTARPPLEADVIRLRADVNQANIVNQAKLTAAKQKATSAYERLQELKEGTRIEEIAQAETQVRQAEANLVQYERDWKRQQALYQEEVISRAEAEQAETSYLVGKETLENAKAKLAQLKAGNRREQISQAEADYQAAKAEVASAEATLRGAKKSGEAQIASLLATPRPEDVAVAKQRLVEAERSRDVARDQVAEAKIALTLAKRRRSETTVTAPFAGTVTQIVTEVGAVTGPNTPLIRLVRTGVPEIRIDLDESNLGKLREGQEAVITNDAFPDARFTAVVQAIGAQVDTDRGTVEVRLTPKNPPAWVRPGQTFTVNIVTGEPQARLVVPATAVNTIAGVSTLLAIEEGKVVKKSIKVSPMGEGGVPVLEGITAETLVITDPTGVVAGESVSPRMEVKK